MSNEEIDLGGSFLKEEIKEQIRRTGKIVTGGIGETGEHGEGYGKYIVTSYHAVEHLESLCRPIRDDKYNEKMEKLGELEKPIKNQLFDDMQDHSKIKFQLLMNLCHRQGVL